MMAVHAQNGAAHYNKGKSEFYTGHYNTCITELKACAQDTSFKDCNYLIALSLFNLKQYSSAVEYFKKDIAAHKKNTNAYLQLAKCYSLMHKGNKANRCYNSLLKIQSDYYLAYFEKGNIKFRQKKYKPAIELYNKTLSYKPQFENAFYQLGYCFLGLKDTTTACNYWNKIQDLDDFENYQQIEQLCLANKHISQQH